MARRGRVLDVISMFLNNEEFSFALRRAYKLAYIRDPFSA